MKESKNIDRLFQEKFKDFEALPGDHVWDGIAASRDKKDRKIIPIWLWRLGGIAALLALLITIGSIWTSKSSENQVVDTENTQEKNAQEGIVENPAIVNPDQDLQTPLDNAGDEKSPSGIATVSGEQGNLKESSSTNNNTTQNKANTAQTGIAINNNKTSGATAEKLNSNTDNSTVNTAATAYTNNTTDNTAIALGENQNREVKTAAENEDKPTTPLFKEDINTTNEVISEEGIAANEEQSENTANTKSLVETAQLIAQQEEEDSRIEDNSTRRKWDVGAVAAPVFYSDFGGSGIDPQFNDNSKTRNANLSYGVQVSYAINDKLKIRSGISNVDLSYNTNDIAFIPGDQGFVGQELALRGVDVNNRGLTILVLDQRGNGASDIAQQAFPGGGNIAISDGSLVQSLNYYEIPMEALYVLSDKRIGVELIGGLSTLILNNDQIEIESNGARTLIGNSNAVNDVSFTTNIGIGLNYKLTDKVKINLEPSLKYQLNAFDDAVGDFRPYIIGVYTGINYRF